MTMMDESELRHRFAQLRDLDRERVTTFVQTCARDRFPRTRLTTFRIWPLAIGAAATVAIAAVWLVRARSYTPSAIAPTITTWRAPTDVLLRTPGSEILAEMPALGASVLDTMIPTPSKRGT